MKKLTFILALAAIAAAFVPGKTLAAEAGAVYATDIKAYLNGVEVTSYNIDGKTALPIEDITTGYTYNDSLRTLIVDPFYPDCLIPGSNAGGTPGEVIGSVYETDIKTYVGGRLVPSYNIGGKTAVAIEDMAGNGEFGEACGRYDWNGEKRTIKAELLYSNAYEVKEELLAEKRVSLIIGNDYTISIKPEPLEYTIIGSIGMAEGINALTVDGKTVGFSYPQNTLRFVQTDDGDRMIEEGMSDLYFDIEALREAMADIEPAIPTYEDYLAYFDHHLLNIIDEFKTDDYAFFHLSFALSPHSTSQYLQKVNLKDGTSFRYDSQVCPGVDRWFYKDVSIDGENELVYFTCTGRNESEYDGDYVLNLKTDEITRLEKKD